MVLEQKTAPDGAVPILLTNLLTCFDINVHATVLGSTFVRGNIRDRLEFTLAAGSNDTGRYTTPDQVIHDTACTLFRKRLVIGYLTRVIGMPNNRDEFDRLGGFNFG